MSELSIEVFAEYLGDEPHVVMILVAETATTVSLPLNGALQLSALFTQQLYLASHLEPGQTTRQE